MLVLLSSPNVYIYVYVRSYTHALLLLLGFFLYIHTCFFVFVFVFLFLSFCSCHRPTSDAFLLLSLSLTHTHRETFTHSHVRTRSVLFLLFTVRDAHTAAPALCLVSRSVGGVLFSSSARALLLLASFSRAHVSRLFLSFSFSLCVFFTVWNTSERRTRCQLARTTSFFPVLSQHVSSPPFPPPPPPPPSKTLTPLSSSPHSTPSFPLSQFPKRTDPTWRNSFTTFPSSSSSSSLEYEWRASARASLLHTRLTPRSARGCAAVTTRKSTLKKSEEKRTTTTLVGFHSKSATQNPAPARALPHNPTTG